MRKIIVYILTILFFASCSESEYNAMRTPSLNRRYLYVSSSTLDFTSSASKKTLNIEADATPWKITIPTSWATVNKATGNNSDVVEFSVELNNSADTSRVCIADISSDVNDWAHSYAVTLTQEKASPYLQLSESSLMLDGKKQIQNVEISSNVKYNVQSSADWLSIVSHSEKVIEFSVQENTTGNSRSAQVSLSTTGINKVIIIVQRAANITTTTESLNFSFEASSASVEIETEASWAAVCSEWIGLSKSTGIAGKVSLTVEVPKNASANSRHGFVYFTIDGTNRIEIPVNQEGIKFSLANDNIEFDSFGGTRSLDISSNNSWQVVSCPEWVEVSPTFGTGDSKINVNVKENDTTTPLIGKIELTTTDAVIKRTVNVSQLAKFIDFDIPTITFAYNEGDKILSFSTNGSWTAYKDQDWISLDKTEGVGNGSITVHAQENMTLSERRGTINITIANQNYIVNIYQGSKYLTLSSSAFEFDSSVGHTSISIGSNTKWSVSVRESPNWLIATPSSGYGNADIIVGVSENNTPDERNGVVEIEIPNVHTYLINITQAGKYIRTDKSSIDFTSVGGTIILNIETDGTYDVSKSGNWFGYTKSGNSISVIAPTNSTGTIREGSLVLRMTNLSQGEYELVIPVIQSSSL